MPTPMSSPKSRNHFSWRFFVSILLPLLVMPAEGAVFGHSAQGRGQDANTGATDRLVVRYRNKTGQDALDNMTLQSAERAAARVGALVKHLRRTGSGSHVLRLDRKLSSAQMQVLVNNLRAADPMVEFADVDRVVTPQFIPNDPSFTSQWGYHDPVGGANLPSAWDKTTGAGITVAVIDTGYRPHADLKSNIVAGYDFITSSLTANDGNGRDASALDPGDWVDAGECGAGSPARNSSWHGTHVAGTIAAVTGNGAGVAGTAFGARVQPLRVLGKCGGFMSDIADAILWASGAPVPGVPANATPARVINLSLGGAGACDLTTQTAINLARSRGTVVVVAAGNSGSDAAGHTPANCSGVVTVGAVGRQGARAYYSNYGSTVDVMAPGGDQSVSSTAGILSTLNTGTKGPGTDSYAYYQGTSMATPHVAGIVALMLARNNALTPDDVEARLRASARPMPVACSEGCGAGIVDASAAVDAAIGPPPPAVVVMTPPVPTAAEIEPNDSLASAQRLDLGVTILGSLATTTDTDYFVISIPAGRTVSVSLTPGLTSDFDLYAYNAAGSRVATSTKGTGMVESITLTNSSAASSLTAYLRVVYFGGSTGSTAGGYSLLVK